MQCRIWMVTDEQSVCYVLDLKVHYICERLMFLLTWTIWNCTTWHSYTVHVFYSLECYAILRIENCPSVTDLPSNQPRLERYNVCTPDIQRIGSTVILHNTELWSISSSFSLYLCVFLIHSVWQSTDLLSTSGCSQPVVTQKWRGDISQYVTNTDSMWQSILKCALNLCLKKVFYGIQFIKFTVCEPCVLTPIWMINKDSDETVEHRSPVCGGAAASFLGISSVQGTNVPIHVLLVYLISPWPLYPQHLNRGHYEYQGHL